MNTARLVRWALIVVGVLVLVAVVSAVWTGLWSWMPWSAESRLQRAETQRDIARNEADARTLESQGQAEQIDRIQTDSRMRIEVAGITSQAIAEAQGADDADTALDQDRAARLSAHDRSLCIARPGVCQPAAPVAP